MAGAAVADVALLMAHRNGGSSYLCLGCRGELGTIRRTDGGVRVFAVVPGLRARYVEAGVLEVVCGCGKVSPVDWRGRQR